MSNPNYPQQPGYPQQPYPQQQQPDYGQQPYPQQPYQQQPYPQPAPSQALSSNLKTAAIILGVSAIAIIIGIAAKSWFTAAGGEGRIGVSGLEACRRDQCMSISWGDFPKAPGEIKAFAYISLYGGIASVICLAIAAVMIVLGNVRKVPWKVFNGILGFTVFGVVSFLVRGMFGEMSKGTTISYAGFFALAGIIAGSTVLLKLVKPETEKPA